MDERTQNLLKGFEVRFHSSTTVARVMTLFYLAETGDTPDGTWSDEEVEIWCEIKRCLRWKYGTPDEELEQNRA